MVCIIRIARSCTYTYAVKDWYFGVACFIPYARPRAAASPIQHNTIQYNTTQYNTVARGTKKEKITRKKNQRAVPATVSMTARNTNNTNISHTRSTSRNDLRYDTASHPTPSKVRCDCCTINSEGLQHNTTTYTPVQNPRIHLRMNKYYSAPLRKVKEKNTNTMKGRSRFCSPVRVCVSACLLQGALAAGCPLSIYPWESEQTNERASECSQSVG